MADYKAIKGYTIQSVSSDNAVLTVGDIWYNSTLGKLRVAKLAAGAWAAGGAINTARTTHGGAGTQTSALIFAGTPGVKDITASYDGSSWTEVADLNTPRNDTSGCGPSNTAAICIMGDNPTAITNVTELWNGASWTEIADGNTGRFSLAACGTTTATLITGGRTPSYTGVTETWDGSSWTETGDMSTTRAYFAIAGNTTAALGISSYNNTSPTTANVEEFDGSSWTEVANVNTARWGIGGTGITTAALAFAGQPPFTGKTEEFDGSSWTEVADIPQAHNYGLNSVGTQSSALTAGGQHPSIGQLNLTFEWDKSVGATNFDVT